MQNQHQLCENVQDCKTLKKNQPFSWILANRDWYLVFPKFVHAVLNKHTHFLLLTIEKLKKNMLIQ
jgi:hypothetical protein